MPKTTDAIKAEQGKAKDEVRQSLQRGNTTAAQYQ